MKTTVKPFLKWAGGKSNLLPQMTGLFPKELEKFDTFIEPFVGGGAVLFHILSYYPNIKNVVINDINARLMNTYVILKESPRDLISILDKYQTRFWSLSPLEQKQFYLEKRERFNSVNTKPVEAAALFLFLNRTCFNGLYRVNKNGKFNVPFGQYQKPLICNPELIIELSKLLQKVTILNGDYAHTIANFRGNTFVYFDPPYRPISQTSNFTTYSSEGFDETQQKRLACFCRLLDFDSKWMLSNSCPMDDNFFNEHYTGYKIRQIKARRSIGASVKSRGNIQELLITNY
ncbi:DNA adenine methylase [Maribellus maritimus]|uniref:DNA adenine methylase n=1 Tax=Maribellus maritimus TaxID=2870838 RepID=UPI001EEA8D3A|nr:DNA adenine methylase [Maribellus maritimus]MCG6191444.1 DNA adenine methylase [Maribellus maritimus]